MNGFETLSPELRAIVLEALHSHIKKLRAEARSGNQEAADAIHKFEPLAQKLEAMTLSDQGRRSTDDARIRLAAEGGMSVPR